MNLCSKEKKDSGGKKQNAFGNSKEKGLSHNPVSVRAAGASGGGKK